MSSTSVFFKGAAFGILILLSAQLIILYLGFQYFLRTKQLIKPRDDRVPSTVQDNQQPKEEFYKDDDSESSSSKQPLLEQEGEAKEYSLPWPQEITSRLKRWLTPLPAEDIMLQDNALKESSNSAPESEDQKYPLPCAHTKTKDAEWLNIIMNRMFLTLRSSKVFRNIWAKKVSNKMNMKLKGNSFVSSIAITDLFLGENPPSFEGVRLLKGLSKELAIMGEVDIIYRGGASICIETHLANGAVVPMQVFMNDLNGTLRVRLPSERWADMIGFAFVDDPGVTFRVESSLALMENQMLKSMVNGVLSSVMRKTFLELWVLPNWRTSFIPLLEPTLDDWLTREEESKALDINKKQKVTIASRATQLWESGQLGGNIQSLLKRPVEKIRDCMENTLFPPNTLLPKDPETLLNVFENPLVTSLTALISEPLEETNRARSISDRLKFPPPPPGDDVTASGDIVADESSSSTAWKEVRRKGDVSVQKKKVIEVDGGSFEVSRASVAINCDANRTFSILSNPLHFRHVYETFLGSKVLFDDGENNSAHSCTFQMGKLEKKLNIFQSKMNGADDGIKIVAMRSIGGSVQESPESLSDLESTASTIRQRPGKLTEGPAADETSIASSLASTKTTQKSTTHFPLTSSSETESDFLFLFGYQVVKVGEATCTVTALSQFSGELQRLDVDFAFCRKLKQFIEELTQLTDPTQPSTGTTINKYFNAEDLKVTSEKLASYLGTAKSYLRTTSFKSSRRSSQTEDFQSIPDDAVAPAPLATENDVSKSSETLANIPYCDLTIPPKERVSVEINFNRDTFEDNIAFKWEYIQKEEGRGTFGIHFFPSDDSFATVKALPYAGSNARILLPIAQYNSYSRPSFGVIDFSALPSGTIRLIFEHNGFNSRAVTYRTHLQGSSQSKPECSVQVTIGRKSFISIPIIASSSLSSSSLSICFNSFANVVPFALYLDPTSNGDPGAVVVRKTIIANSSSSRPGSNTHIVDLKDMESLGVFNAAWDNSQSLLSTREVDIHISFK